MEDQTTDKKVDHLTPEYYKARRGLMLFSGLLLAWELIGIELSQKLNIESLNLDITIKSPQAAPAVLIILVIYFSIRIAIEWHQSPSERRKEKASVADIILTTTVVVASLSISALQFLLKIQIVDIIDGISIMAIISSFLTPLSGYILFINNKYLNHINQQDYIKDSLSNLFFILILIIITLYSYVFTWHNQTDITYNNIIIMSSFIFTIIITTSCFLLGTIITFLVHNFILKTPLNKVRLLYNEPKKV